MFPNRFDLYMLKAGRSKVNANPIFLVRVRCLRVTQNEETEREILKVFIEHATGIKSKDNKVRRSSFC